MNSYTLGLDIGSNSIGWALLDTGRKPRIVDIGVRVFPEGVDRDTKGMEKSKNATRREARGARRIHHRRTLRRRQLVQALRGAGLLPEGKRELAALLKKYPYEVRARGLDKEVGLYELGRALYHINQRRGFKSNRKSEKKQEEGQIAKAAGDLQGRIDDAKCMTLGEYFAHVDPEDERIRGRYTFRSMYEKEFDLLWAKQAEFHPDVLTEDLQRRIRDEIIFYQRPLKPTDDLIGDCQLEKDENGKPLKRCARGDWYARRFRLLQDVNNLRIWNPDGSVEKLTDEQREIVLDELSRKKEAKFSTIRKKLGLLETQRLNAEYEVNERGKKNEKLVGDVFNAGMRGKKVFGPKVWGGMEEEKKIRLNDWIVDLEDEELVEKLTAEYDLGEEQMESILKIFLPSGYMSFSRKAIQRLLPLMEAGKRTDEALDEIYPDRRKRDTVEEVEKLGLPSDLRNPIVNRALFEVRKVVNAIVRAHGKPGRIKVEMARDVRGNARQRKELHFKMLENERRNEEVRKRLIEDDIVSKPSREDIIKYKLWEECGHVCPYTGKQISQTALFGSNPTFQIEHILPYSRSLDDSFMNKTLCEVHENIQVKGNQSPYEAYSHDPDKFEELKQRVNRTAMPYWKKRKFWQKEIDTDEIISRELNDTRYICREVVKYLKGICRNVTGTRGKATAELRYQWGFIKDRDDHRHHAIDASVVAVTKNKHLRELGETKYSSEGAKFAPPWGHFREELGEKVKHINVSHRANRKVSGALHEETNYGPTGYKDVKGQDVFVYRKKLEDLTVAMVEKIVDPVVRAIVKGRVVEKGVDLSKSGKIPKEAWSEPVYMKRTKSDRKVRIKKVRISGPVSNAEAIRDRDGRTYRYVKPGSNHHVEIWEYTGGEKQGTRDAEVVSMFEAVRRSRAGEPVVKRERGANATFICSLAINDMVMLPVGDEQMDLFRVQRMSVIGQIYFRGHTAATIDDDSTLIRRQGHLFDGYKVVVDCLGRVHRAND